MCERDSTTHTNTQTHKKHTHTQYRHKHTNTILILTRVVVTRKNSTTQFPVSKLQRCFLFYYQRKGNWEMESGLCALLDVHMVIRIRR